jgi:hypothetical protein
MEAVSDFLPFQDTDQASGQAGYPGVEDALTALQGWARRGWRRRRSGDSQTASDFAGRVEELSRTVEYLQLVAAAAGGPHPETGHVDDGYRNTMEFLRARLRIGAAEARRRLALAEDLLPEPHDWMRQPKKSQPRPTVTAWNM